MDSLDDSAVGALVFINSILFFASGIVITVFGALKLSYYSEYALLLDSQFFAVPTLMIVVGCCIFFSFIFIPNCFREDSYNDSCLSRLLAVLILVICILELSSGMTALVLRDKISPFLRYELQDKMKYYQFSSNNPNTTTLLWDKVQVKFKCCGTNGPRDWSRIPHQEVTAFGINQSNDLPWSCCNDKGTGIDCKLNKTGSYFKTGCVDAFGDNIKDQMLTLGLVCVILFYVNAGGFLVITCSLFQDSNDDDDEEDMF